MTREDIIRWAREVEDYADTIYEKGEYHPGWLEVRDAHFAALVAEAEREAQRKLLTEIRDALRRMDPAWCALHGQEQISDEELEELIARVEDAVEDGDGTPA